MKQTFLWTMRTIIFMSLAAFLITCKSVGDRNNNGNEELKTDTTSIELSPAQMDTLVFYQARRDKTRVDFEEIRTRSKNSQLKDDLKEASDEMEEKLDQLDKKIDQLGRSSKRGWNKMKLEIDSLLTDLDKAITKTKNNLKSKS